MALLDETTGRYYKINYVEPSTGYVSISVYRSKEERDMSNSDDLIAVKNIDERLNGLIKTNTISIDYLQEILDVNNAYYDSLVAEGIDPADKNFFRDAITVNNLLITMAYQIIKNYEPFSNMKDC